MTAEMLDINRDVSLALFFNGITRHIDKETGQETVRMSTSYEHSNDRIMVDIPLAPRNNSDVYDRAKGIINAADHYDPKEMALVITMNYSFSKERNPEGRTAAEIANVFGKALNASANEIAMAYGLERSGMSMTGPVQNNPYLPKKEVLNHIDSLKMRHGQAGRNTGREQNRRFERN